MVTVMIFGSGMQGPLEVNIDIVINIADERQAGILMKAVRYGVLGAYDYISCGGQIDVNTARKALEPDNEG